MANFGKSVKNRDFTAGKRRVEEHSVILTDIVYRISFMLSMPPTYQIFGLPVWGEHIEYLHSDEEPGEETRGTRNQQSLPKESDDTDTPHPERPPIKMSARSKPLDPGLLRKV